jgi:hypothetical protein
MVERVVIAQCLEHVAGDAALLAEIKAEQAHQRHFRVAGNRSRPEFLTHAFDHRQCLAQVVPIHAQGDVILFLQINQVHNEFDVDSLVAQRREELSTYAWA